MLDFDLMLMHVGEFGLYQKILFVFQAPFCVFVTFVLFGQLFMVIYPMNYWCDQHFACLDENSFIPAAQRRNISFAWRDDGLLRNDPCEVNNIDDSFLRELHSWDKGERCSANRSIECQYPENTGTTSASKVETTTPFIGPPPRIQAGDRESWRTKRSYGSFQARAPQWKIPRTFEDRNRHKWNPTTKPPAISTEAYSEAPSPTPPSTTESYFTTAPTTTTKSIPSTEKPGSQNGQQESPQSGMVKGKKEPQDCAKGIKDDPETFTNLTSFFVGWPMPECSRSERFSVTIGMNSRIYADQLMRRFGHNNSYGVINDCSCKVRWNRSEVTYITIVTEGNWWCNAELYTTFSQAVFFLGAIVGGFLIGWIADTFGRVPALVIANVLGALGGALSAISTNVWVFSAFRFITGMAFDNCFTMMYILVLEFCGPSYRTLVANLSIAVFYTLGTIALPLLAWLISNWRIYALVISLPMLLGLLALFFVPESARWLLSKGRAKEATQILRNFAKVNRRKVDESVFINFEKNATQLFAEMEMEEKEPGVGAALKTPRLRKTFIILVVFWALISLVYDGHSRNIMNLADDQLNVFWLFGIASMTEFPADMLLIFTLDRFGRRWLAFGALFLSGAFSFIAAAITRDIRIPFLITAIISRFFVNVAFNVGLQYAAELLPTVIRAQGVNAIHIMGYVASVISPFVAAIGRSSPALSLFILGGCAVCAGILALFLSETLGEELPNTLEEAEAFGRNQSFWNCPICAKESEETYPISVPQGDHEERPVVMRNALRASIRGETYRSSMISSSPSASSRKSQMFGMSGRERDRIAQAPEPTQTPKSRRITH